MPDRRLIVVSLVLLVSFGSLVFTSSDQYKITGWIEKVVIEHLCGIAWVNFVRSTLCPRPFGLVFGTRGLVSLESACKIR